MRIPSPPSPEALLARAAPSGRAGPLVALGLLGLAVTGLAAVSSPSGAPVAGRATPTVARVALRPPPPLALVAPSRLAVGDRVEAEVRLPGDPAALAGVEVAAEVDGEALEVGAPRPAGVHGGARLWLVPLEASAAGTATLRIRARWTDDPAAPTSEARAEVVVRPVARDVTLVTNVELVGPAGRADALLDPRAADLRGPRALVLRALPGLAAEVQLGLEGLATVPHGCFEQTTAATYPSVLALELAQQDHDVDLELLERARACAEAGAARLEGFQHEDGAFSLHGPGSGSDVEPWLTAVGVAQLAQLADVLDLDRAPVRRAARALVARWQGSTGAFRMDATRRRGSDVAVTAYAAGALLAAGEEREAARAALAWLEEVAGAPGRDAYELALTARALLADPARAGAGRALAARLARLATRHADGAASWPACPTTTCERDDVEVTGVAAQAIIRAGVDPALAAAALRWLAARRTERGFGGTQATVQALQAFRDGRALREPGRGVLEVELPGRLPQAQALAPDAGLTALPLVEAADEAALDAVLERGLRLRFTGSGRVHAQVVLTGVVAWDDPAWRAGSLEGEAPALRVRTVRPASGRQGEAQRWALVVENTRPAAVRDPMLELALPPGFALANDDGGLVAHRDAGRVRRWEVWHDRLVLYLRDLAPDERLELALRVVPTLTGDFTAGALHAYPYYDPAQASVVGPQRLRVHPPRGRQPVVAPRPAPAPACSTVAPTPAASVDDVAPVDGEAVVEVDVDDDVVAGGGGRVVGWDPRLGPLDVARLNLPLGAGPLERLVARALLRGLPSAAEVVELTPDQAWEFFLPPDARWSDGRAVTVDDYLAAWEAARRQAPALAHDLQVDPAQLALLDGLVAEPLGPFRLRVRLARPVVRALERLDGWPFLPRAPFGDPDGGLVTNGACRVARATPDVLVIAGPGLTGPGGLVVRRGAPAALRWGPCEARAGVVPLGPLGIARDRAPPVADRDALARTLGWWPPSRRDDDDDAPPLAAAAVWRDDPRLAPLGDLPLARAPERGDGGLAVVGRLPSHLAGGRPADLDACGFLKPATR